MKHEELEEHLSMLEEWDVSYEYKVEWLQTLHNLVTSIVDLAFDPNVPDASVFLKDIGKGEKDDEFDAAMSSFLDTLKEKEL